MKLHTTLRLALTGLGLVLIAGCSRLNEMRALREDIAHSTDSSFDTGITFALGPGMTHTASWITRQIDDADARAVSRALEGVRRIKGAVYPIEYPGNLDTLDPSALPHFRRGEWQIALKTLDDDDVSWVFFRERRGSVRDIYTVVLTDNELVLVRVHGHLNALLDLMIDEALAESATIVDGGR